MIRRYLIVLSFVLAILPTGVMADQAVEIVVEGLAGAELENVRLALEPPPGLVEEGRVNRTWLERYLRAVPERVRAGLEPFGYYDPTVTAELEGAAVDGHVVRVQVVPGEPVLLTAISVRVEGPGAAEKELEEFVRALPLVKGDVLHHRRYEDAREKLRQKAIDLGYIDADYSERVVRVSPERLEATVTLTLETGPRFFFGTVTLAGSDRYPGDLLRRYLTFREGDVFSYAKLAETRLNLANADLFRDIVVTAEKERAREGHVPVVINLAPAPAKRLRGGVGFGTDTGARLSLRYRDGNVLRRGHTLESEANVSERLQGLAARYVIPSADDLRTHTGFRASLQREETKTYDSTQTSFEGERVMSLGDGRLGSLFLQLTHENSKAGDQRTSSLSVVPGVRLNVLGFDDPLRPARGYRCLAEIKATHRALGSETGFARFLFNGGAVFPLQGRLSFLTRLHLGATIQEEGLSELPIPFRFFAGGDRSVRGYGYQTLGPKGDAGKVVGGKHLFVWSGEVERAVGEDWGIAAFYDTGNAFDSFSSMSLVQAAGLGVRYYTRVGPIRLDVARQIDEKRPVIRVHFTVGFEL